MSSITTHILDTSRGRPAPRVPVVLEVLAPGGEWRVIGKGDTDADGRIRDLLPPDHAVVAGLYRITFDVRVYWKALSTQAFYPIIPVVFELRQPGEHYHVPLLLSPFGFSTYRGT